MSTDEDFSLVMLSTEPSEDTLEGIKALTDKYKKQHEVIKKDQKHLITSRDMLQVSASQYRERANKLKDAMKKDKVCHEEQLAEENAKILAMKQEEVDLMKQMEELEAALKEEDGAFGHLREQAEVFSAVPEKKVVFKGMTGQAREPEFELKSKIVWPMDGGTALITFEEEEVAAKILKMGRHKIKLDGGCSITVEASPVQLLLPKLVEIESEVCPRRILISNLPKMDTEMLLNKLEIHFSKTKNGGGEVEDREFLPDSGNVVLTFLKPDFSKGLVATENHEVKLVSEKKAHKVRVTPFLNGKIRKFQTKWTLCSRTVLLTGIPAVMDQDTLQDHIEIHFQKSSNGGGEVVAFLYNPEGMKTSALFQAVPEKKGED